MTKEFFIIGAHIRGCRKKMYFTGNSNAGGKPLFSTDVRYAVPFLKEDAANVARMSVAPTNSAVEPVQSLDWFPKESKNREAAV